jgi:hypothetical protein
MRGLRAPPSDLGEGVYRCVISFRQAVQVLLRRDNAAVAQPFLHDLDVGAAREESRGMLCLPNIASVLVRACWCPVSFELLRSTAPDQVRSNCIETTGVEISRLDCPKTAFSVGCLVRPAPHRSLVILRLPARPRVVTDRSSVHDGRMPGEPGQLR